MEKLQDSIRHIPFFFSGYLSRCHMFSSLTVARTAKIYINKLSGCKKKKVSYFAFLSGDQSSQLESFYQAVGAPPVGPWYEASIPEVLFIVRTLTSLGCREFLFLNIFSCFFAFHLFLKEWMGVMVVFTLRKGR